MKYHLSLVSSIVRFAWFISAEPLLKDTSGGADIFDLNYLFNCSLLLGI